MNFFNFLTTNFSLDTIVVSMVISVITILIELIFKDKIPTLVKTIAPFIFGAIFYCVYKLVTHDKLEPTSIISSGVTAGSLSLTIKAFVSSLKNKSGYNDLLYLTVKEILNDYYSEEKLEKITNILSDYLKNFKSINAESLFEGLMLKLKEFDDEINDFYATTICISIEKAFNSLSI